MCTVLQIFNTFCCILHVGRDYWCLNISVLGNRYIKNRIIDRHIQEETAETTSGVVEKTLS